MSASPPHAENDSEQQLQLVGGDTDNDDRPDQSRGRHESEEPQGGIPGRSGAHRDDRSTSPDRRRVPPALRTPFEDDNLSKFADDLQSEAPLRFSTPKRIGPAFQEELVMSSAHGGKLAQVQAPGDVDTKEAVTYGAAPSLALPVTLEGLEHPYNWPARRKWLITLQAALLIFSSTITSSAPSGGSVVFQQEYGINSTVAELLVSVFLLGYVVGPFITAPSTEAYGRRWPSIACMALYTIFNGACAGCSSITPLLVCRFFAGMWASGPISTSASIVTDIWVPKDRNFVMSIWSIGSFSGPALGPVVGGFISVSGLPTRWIFIVMTILTGAMTLFIACCLPETYEPELVKRKMARLQKEAGLSRTLSQTSRKSQGREDFWQTLKTLLTRPFILFVNEPLLILSTLYSSFAYAVLYLLFPLYPIIFREIHGIQPGLADLPFVAILIGVVSAISVTYLFQRKYVRDLKRAGGKHTPELRLPPAFAGGPIMLVSLLWLGWTGNTARISPYAPAFSGVLTGLASVLIFRSFSSYVIECYKAYGASAMATLVIWRSLFAAGLPLAVAPMVRSLGVGWTATLLAGFQATLIPIPFLFYRYGPVIRQRSKYSQDD